MSTALTKRLSADAFQHLMKGHIHDYSCNPDDGWLVHVEPVEVPKGKAPFGADAVGLTDAEFQTLLMSLPAHGQPVRVFGPMPAGTRRSTATKATSKIGVNIGWQAARQKVTEYPEFATSTTHTGGTRNMTTTRKATTKAPAKKATATTKKVGEIIVVPVGFAKAKAKPAATLPDEVTVFLANLVHEPKRVFATSLAEHKFLGAAAPVTTGAAFEAKAEKRLDYIAKALVSA